MKKALALIMVMVICFGLLAGCGDSPAPPASSGSATSAATPDDGAPAATPDDGAPMITAEEAKNIKPVELTFHSHEPTNSDASAALLEWCDLINEVSGGTIKITTFFDGVLGTNNDSAFMVLDGAVDLAWGTQNGAQGAFPMSLLFTLPRTGINSAAMASAAMMDLLEETDYLTAEYDDYYVICLHGHNSANMIINKDVQVNSIADLKGLAINSTGAWTAKFLTGIGVNVLSMVSGEVYSSMEKGLLDGMVGDYNQVRAFSFYELAKTYVELDLGCVPGYILMNKAKYESLDPAQQEILDYYGGRYLLDNYLDEAWASSIPFVAEKAEEYNATVILPSETLAAELNEAAVSVQNEWIQTLTEQGYDAQGIFDWLQNWVADHADEY